MQTVKSIGFKSGHDFPVRDPAHIVFFIFDAFEITKLYIEPKWTSRLQKIVVDLPYPVTSKEFWFDFKNSGNSPD